MKKIITICFILFAFALNAQTTLNLKFFIQGFCSGTGTTIPDTAFVELHDMATTCTAAETFTGVFLSDGTMACTFSSSIAGNSYHIAVKHRSSLTTWSAAPVVFTAITNYDFTIAQTQAYGSSMLEAGPGVWAFYNGDIDGNQNIELSDFPWLDFGINHGVSGYVDADLNGDGNVDLIDFPFLDNNINLGVFAWIPPCP